MRHTHVFRSTTALASILLFTAGAARAGERDAPPPDVAGPAAAVAVQQVVVVADRTPEPLEQVGQSVTVLTLPQLKADQELVVSDILARTPGVTVVRNGGPGGTTSLHIRGAEADQTVVLIDGVQLNDPSSTGGGYDFANLLVGDVSRVEVLRGPQSTLYGSQAIGGVVNIVTADPTRPLEGDAQAEGGSYATGYAKAGVGGRDGPLTWRGAVATYTTDGVSAFDSRLGGKEADGYHNTAVTGRAAYAFTPDLSVDGRVYYAEARDKFDGYPPPAYVFADDQEFGRTQQLVGYTGLNLALFDGRLKNRAALQYTRNDRQDYDPQQAVTPLTFDSSGVNQRAEYEGTFAIAPGYTAVFGAEHERSSFSVASPSAYDPTPAATRRAVTIDSGYGQVQAQVLPGLNLAGGVRYDDHSTFGGRATGQASAAWSLFGGDTVLRASWGQGFKAPTLYQLYSDYGTPTLRPEKADGFDGGVEQRFWGGRGDVQVTGFSRDTSDLIDFFSCPATGAPAACAAQPYGYYANISKARARGVELAGSLRPLKGLELTANYTFTDARDRSPGSATFDKLLTRRPQDTANLQASYAFGFGLTLGAAVRYSGASFDDPANTTRVKSYTLVDLRASYRLPHGLELYGRLENLFDRQYETIYQYGTLGRAATAGVRASF